MPKINVEKEFKEIYKRMIATEGNITECILIIKKLNERIDNLERKLNEQRASV